MFNILKKEPVTIISLILAIISAFLVHPDAEYISYIDFRTLSILLCLMLVMAGLRKEGVFKYIGEKLLARTSTKRGLALVLIILCFFFSMLITNDVALISFVPFSIELINMMHDENKGSLAIKLIVLETIAANLGSMLTPIGNPQNLYLYSLSGISIISFIKIMLPYSLTSLLLLLLFGIFMFPVKKGTPDETVMEEVDDANSKEESVSSTSKSTDRKTSASFSKKIITSYLVLFLLSLLVVIHVLPYQVVLAVTIAVVLLIDRQTITKADYFLLLSFIFLFIFVGNIKRIEPIRDALQNVLSGREVITSIIASQFISNVPAAILLSGMTDKLRLLIVGTNLGGLGTLIASMASLISFKFYGQMKDCQKGRYVAVFTLLNVVFLAILASMNVLIALG
ncbi:SLC13 family permease [Butyrivibrio fibrisolvens]|uniref:SLC13 family permease n=1 Tax=Butyrivibrio fibrisolvens TaxID=831 RepID=UPI0003B39D8B|nr:SLC13 family permease [Butyrivibrio fibrisolvens]